MIRLLDILFSGLALICLSPVLLLLAIAIPLETRGNPIFRQTRIGKNGQSFQLNKFRSMVKNAPELGGFSTRPGDPRITRIGKFIRATSLDESPQVWNIIIGDMSLVGPRPDVPAQKQLYTTEEWQKRTSIRPGLTGLAQVMKRSNATHEERLLMDLEYVDQQSVALYLKILFSTARLVLTKLAH